MTILNEFRPTGSKVLMLTGALAQSGLERVMEALDPKDFEYEIRVMPVQVAAWLNTIELIHQIGDTTGFDLVIIPGKTSGDEYDLESAINTRVIKGPKCYSELPLFFEEHGFVLNADVPKPRIAVIGADDEAKQIAKQYELPFIDFMELVKEEISRKSPIGKEVATSEEIRHNIKAEIVRSRISLPDAQNGWVMINYPSTERDVQWMDEMQATPDIIFYTDEMFMVSPLFAPAEKGRLENMIVTIEKRMNECVAKNI